MSKTKEAKQTEANEATVRSQSKTLAAHKHKYEPYQRGNGNVSLDNGDTVAKLLRNAGLDEVLRAAEIAKGHDKGFLVKRYEGRNPGSKRMNAGNILRGVARTDGEYTKEGVAQVKAALTKASKELNTVKS